MQYMSKKENDTSGNTSGNTSSNSSIAEPKTPTLSSPSPHIGDVVSSNSCDVELVSQTPIESSAWIAVLTHDDFHPRNSSGYHPVEKAYRTLEFFESINNFKYMIHLVSGNIIYGKWKAPVEEEICADFHTIEFIQENGVEWQVDIYEIDAISINMEESSDITSIYEQYMQDEQMKKKTKRKKSVAKNTKEAKSPPRKCIEIAGNSKKRCKQNAVGDSDYCWLHDK